MIQPIPPTPLPWARASIDELHESRVRICAPISLLVHVELTLSRPRGRAGHLRPLALTGNLHFPELRAEIAIRGPQGVVGGNGHAEDRQATATIIPRDFTLAFPSQSLAARTSEGRDLWALTPAADRDPPWIEHYAGRIKGDALQSDHHVAVEGILDVALVPEERGTGGGVNVDVTGALRFEHALRMRLVLRDPEQPTALASDSEADEVVVIAEGSRIAIHQAITSPAGRDSWMRVRVIEPESRVVRMEQLLTARSRNAA